MCAPSGSELTISWPSVPPSGPSAERHDDSPNIDITAAAANNFLFFMRSLSLVEARAQNLQREGGLHPSMSCVITNSRRHWQYRRNTPARFVPLDQCISFPLHRSVRAVVVTCRVSAKYQADHACRQWNQYSGCFIG